MSSFKGDWALPVFATLFGILAIAPLVHHLFKTWNLKQKSKNASAVIEKFLVTKVCSQHT